MAGLTGGVLLSVIYTLDFKDIIYKKAKYVIKTLY